MEYQKKDIIAIVSKMKRYYKLLYKLTPADLAEFMKIRSNFIRIGIPLSDELLSKPEEEIIQFVSSKLSLTSASPEKVEVHTTPVKTDINDTLAIDLSYIDDDRTEIRKQLFNENISVTLERTGKVFNVGWNGKMTVCKISIPSMWHINASQSLLLDIFEKDKKMFDNPNAYEITSHNGMTKLGGFLYELLIRHTDYSIIKRMFELEFENNNSVFNKNIDKRKLSRLKNRGFSYAVSALLIALAEQVQAKTFSEHYIITLLGYRKRLIQEFNILTK